MRARNVSCHVQLPSRNRMDMAVGHGWQTPSASVQPLGQAPKPRGKQRFFIGTVQDAKSTARVRLVCRGSNCCRYSRQWSVSSKTSKKVVHGAKGVARTWRRQLEYHQRPSHCCHPYTTQQKGIGPRDLQRNKLSDEDAKGLLKSL
jgi:hypothetical protein